MTVIDFWDEAQAKLGFYEPVEDLSFEQGERILELAEQLYSEWSEGMMAAEEYEYQRNPGLQL